MHTLGLNSENGFVLSSDVIAFALKMKHATPSIDDVATRVMTPPCAAVQSSLRGDGEDRDGGRMRFRGDQKGKCKLRFEIHAKKTVVTAYRNSQLNVKSKFRGVLKDVDEKHHFSRIEREGLKVVQALELRTYPLKFEVA